MSDILLHLAFVFAVLGTKLVLAMWAIYYLLPVAGTCPECDGETLPLQMGLARRLLGAALFLGQVRRRWCPACSWDGFARPARGAEAAIRSLPKREAADRPI